MPTRWIDYTCFDVLFVSQDKIKELANKHLKTWQAIDAWLHAGGTLIVYDTGKRWSTLADLESLLQMGLSPDQKDGDADPLNRDWKLPLKNQQEQPSSTGDLMETSNQKSLGAISLENAPFLTRGCGLGLVVAIPTDESLASRFAPFPWQWLFNTVTPQRWQWWQRWGVSLYQQNNDFWNFLIPGVGLVPVTQFQVLITLFVVILGPVNYYLLRRWGKLNLTILTVPAGALLVTGSLLLYALVEDGLSVRVRGA